METHYLVSASNSMIESLEYIESSGVVKLSPESITHFLQVGCNTLQTLERDGKFFGALYQNLSGPKSRAKDYRETLDYFISAFEKIDRGLMLEAGMDKRMVNYLFKDVELVKNLLHEPRAIDPEKIQHRIVDLKTFVCKESQSRREEKGDRKTIKKILGVVGGGAIVAVNAGVDLIATMGVISELSITFGGTIMGKNL